jgi:hypothetical protein
VYRRKFAKDGAEGDVLIVETLDLIGPGSAAGPLVDAAGGLVGLAIGSQTRGLRRSMFLGAEEVSDFVGKYLKSWGVEWVPEREGGGQVP